MRGAPQRGLARLIFRIRLRTSGDTDGRPSRWRLFQFRYSRKPFLCQVTTVSGLTMSNADCQSFHNRESQTHRTRSAQLRRSLCPRLERCRTRADAGEQESLRAEQRGLGNNLAEREIESAWSGKATRRGFANATISARTDFLVGTGQGPTVYGEVLARRARGGSAGADVFEA